MKKIKNGMSAIEMCMAVSEGHTGAIEVVTKILKGTDRVLLSLGILDILDDHDIRGQILWEFYKDYCKRDIDKLIELIALKDENAIIEGEVRSGRKAIST